MYVRPVNGYPQAVGIAIPSGSAYQALQAISAHPEHIYFGTSPALTEPTFEELVSRLFTFRQVTDATLLSVARANGAKLVTFDRGMRNLCPWIENLEVLAAS